MTHHISKATVRPGLSMPNQIIKCTVKKVNSNYRTKIINAKRAISAGFYFKVAVLRDQERVFQAEGPAKHYSMLSLNIFFVHFLP